MSALILAIPSKGRLQEQSAGFLADCRLPLALADRLYQGALPLPGIEVRLISASEIARTLRDGDAHVGITGEDVLRENDPDLASSILVKPLGFGRADLVLAAPMSWVDVASLADFAEVCAEHRARTGVRLRIATKYARLARRFLDEHGVLDYRLVESLGATEGAPAAGAAEAIIDITTSGATLAANHLRRIPDGILLRSQAQIVASRTAKWDPATHAAFAHFLDIVEARGRAKATRLIRVAPGPQGPAPILERAAALGCKLAGDVEGGALLEIYCPIENVFAVCAALQQLLGGSIGVSESDFVFEQPNGVYQRFASSLCNT
ncbi:MAG: ATP phosphoribosyltransferase [Hyphomonadaceae bacterium]|nr:ATP phosphoribosyltransferase [Hyphomonadaceae bacterium]